ncbi:MAG: asparagine synthase (glutamine-hydrolyzing) [Bacteroidetes bacterium]|nr:asparagine synthase (glutamine-hydrolyzing) [Bacteroidota bacterium]
MCGIAGFTTTQTSSNSYNDAIASMVNAMKHRGPDAQNSWCNDSVYLGHARLSIIDLSEASNQPMLSADGRYVIVYNGELYNYRELKLELQRVSFGSKEQAYFFKTNSDTEVILAAYSRWGASCLDKFNGMYAFALYDTQNNSLFIARDRMGIKPLYYSVNNKQLVFGSEIRTLLNSGFVQRKLNKAVLNEYFLYQTVHAPNTIIEGVKMLMPGTYLTWKNGEIKQFRYWNSNDFAKESEALDYKLTCKKTEELLFKAVERRLVADVPFGAFLSGGIDSSAVVGIMSKLSSRKVETFNVSFDESEFSESKYAKKVSELFNTQHHEIKLKPQNFLNQLPSALNAIDHPSGDGPNTYVVSKATKEAGITMALSGLGGDELFAGYDVFKRMKSVDSKAYLNIFPSWLRAVPASLIKAKNKSVAGDKLFEVLTQEKFSVKEVYPVSRKIFSKQQEKLLLRKNENPLKDIIGMIKKPDANHLLSYVSLLEMNTYMQNILLRDTDQMSMAVALEVRVPFLDYKLVEFVLSVNDEHKFPHSPKKLLIDSLNSLLPGEIINRPKMGFTLPWSDWMKGELKAFCEEKIRALSKRDFVNEGAVIDLWEQFLHDNKKVTWSRLWHLIVFENWLQTNQIE